MGRDLLIGAAYGVLFTIFEQSDTLLLPLFGKLPPMPAGLDPASLLGVRPAIGALLFYILFFVLYSLLIFLLIFILRVVVRRDWIAALVVILLGATTTITSGEYSIATFVFAAIIWASIVLILRRFGLLTLIVGFVVQNILVVFPTFPAGTPAPAWRELSLSPWLWDTASTPPWRGKPYLQARFWINNRNSRSAKHEEYRALFHGRDDLFR